MRRENYYRNETHNNGVGFVGLLTILFIGLKLTGYIDWAWIWVLSPIWISVLIFVCVMLPFVFLLALAGWWKK